MIPCILGPNISFICEKSLAELWHTSAEKWQGFHLDPNGGFCSATSCTEEVDFGAVLSIIF